MRHLACGLLVLAWLLAGTGCQRKVQLSEEGGDQVDHREIDRRCELLLAGKDPHGEEAMEARQYLAPNQKPKPKQLRNMMNETEAEVALKWANDFYQAGAVKVYAVYMVLEDLEANICNDLLVELPTQPDKRAQVFKTYRRILQEPNSHGDEELKDLGQKFLFLFMD